LKIQKAANFIARTTLTLNLVSIVVAKFWKQKTTFRVWFFYRILKGADFSAPFCLFGWWGI